MKKHYWGFIAAFVLLDILVPKTSGCSCSHHEDLEEPVAEQQVDAPVEAAEMPELNQ